MLFRTFSIWDKLSKIDIGFWFLSILKQSKNNRKYLSNFTLAPSNPILWFFSFNFWQPFSKIQPCHKLSKILSGWLQEATTTPTSPFLPNYRLVDPKKQLWIGAMVWWHSKRRFFFKAHKLVIKCWPNTIQVEKLSHFLENKHIC